MTMLTLRKSKNRTKCTLPYNCFVRKAVLRIGPYSYPMIQVEWEAMAGMRKQNEGLVGIPSVFAMHKGFIEAFPAAQMDVNIDVTIERKTLAT